MNKVSLAEKLSLIDDHWHPHIVGSLNGQEVKLVRLKGEFIWHHHEKEDEMFLVISGTLNMCFRDTTVEVNPGEFIIVPRGVEHKPVADEEVCVMLFEPEGTRNTGEVVNERTKSELKKI